MTFPVAHKAAITWAEKYAKHAVFKPVRLMPWSSVYVAETKSVRIFLKIVVPPFDIEIKLLPYLAEQFPEVIPKVIATHPKHQCILMHDAGMPLRDLLKKTYKNNWVKKAVSCYGNLQKNTSHQVDALLALGVPDWRLHTLPQKYLALLQRTKFLTHDGLSNDEITQLELRYPHVEQLCKVLASGPIPDAIEHGDFHDNNILINIHNNPIIHDWGDTVITHPFFSYCSFESSASRHHKISVSQQNLTETCYLDAWSDYATKEVLKHIMKNTKILNIIKFALGFSRIASCPDMHDLGDYKGTVAKALRSYLKTNI
jgi:hypothetical protein